MNKAIYRLLRFLGIIILTMSTFHNVHASELSVLESRTVTLQNTNYYVSKNGNNQDGLSPATAWSELDQINWDSIQPNATINIDGGTYYTSLVIPTGQDDVTITSRAGEVIIDGQFSRARGISINGRGNVSQNIHISGLTIKSFTSYGVYGTGEQTGGMQNIVIDNCKFLNFRRAGVFFEGNGNVGNNRNIIVRNSYFNDDDAYTGQSDGIYVQFLSDFTADNNVIILDNDYTGQEDVHSDNIQAFWVDNITYSNNIIVQKSRKTLGTQMLFTEAGNGVHVFVNNVLYRDCPNAKDWALRLKQTSGGSYLAKVYNNSFIGYGKMLGSDARAEIKNNLLYSLNNAQKYTTGSGSDVSNNIMTTGNPGFVDTNYNTFDLRLEPSSAAIDAGVSLSALYNSDKDGNSRPQGSGYDIGAYELTTSYELSIIRTGANPTAAETVDFRVSFSKAVSGVGSSDFVLATTGVTGASISTVSGAGSNYKVSVNTGSGDGTIRLDLLDDDSIVDGSGNPLGGTGVGNGDYTNGEAYDVEKSMRAVMPSSVAFINQLFHTSNAPTTITITNMQANPITLGVMQGTSEVGTTWNTGQSFFIQNDTCSGATLAVSASCTFDAEFLPWSLGRKEGTITIPSTAPASPYTLSLTGESVPGSQYLLNRSFDSFAVSTGLPNLWLKNQLFKIGLDGVGDSWSFHGPYSVKLVGDGDLKVFSQRVDKAGLAGDDFSFFVTTRAIGIPNDSNRWLMQVMFYNGSTIVENRNVPLKTGTYNFARITQTYTATSDYTHIMFRVHFAKDSGIAWLDLSSLQWAP